MIQFTMKQSWLDSALAPGKAVNLMVLNLLNIIAKKIFHSEESVLLSLSDYYNLLAIYFSFILLPATNELFT